MTNDEEAKRIEKALGRKRGAQRPFPAASFSEAKELAEAILEYGSGQLVRRLSLFDHIGEAPESGASRQWITNAGKYGLIKGSYGAEYLELTSDGAKAVDEEISKREQTKARVKLAIDDIPVFKVLFDSFIKKIPRVCCLN